MTAVEKAHATVASVTAMPADPISSSGRRPIRSTVAIVNRHARDRQHARQDVGHQARRFLKSRPPPTGCAIIEDDVDADELLEHREADPDPEDRADTGRSPCRPDRRTWACDDPRRGWRRFRRPCAAPRPRRTGASARLRASAVAILDHKEARAIRGYWSARADRSRPGSPAARTSSAMPDSPARIARSSRPHSARSGNWRRKRRSGR